MFTIKFGNFKIKLPQFLKYSLLTFGLWHIFYTFIMRKYGIIISELFTRFEKSIYNYYLLTFNMTLVANNKRI